MYVVTVHHNFGGASIEWNDSVGEFPPQFGKLRQKNERTNTKNELLSFTRAFQALNG
jgi:hypothetical protein